MYSLTGMGLLMLKQLGSIGLDGVDTLYNQLQTEYAVLGGHSWE